MASDPSAMPHLNHCYPELRELCDIEAIIEGVRIPLHSQILSRESRLFAQFFSSFHSSGDKGATTAAISQLFDDFDLPTALLAILLVYKPADVEVELVFIKQRWGYGSSTDYGLPDIDAALLQRTFRLLDKLDVRGVLATLVTLPDLYDMIAADRVGWLSASWLIEPGIYMYAVMGIVRSVSDWPSASPTGALTIVTESRWDELPHQAVLLLTECMITRPQFGIPNVLHLLYWRAMGDVVHNIALRLKGASALDDTSDEMLRPPTVVQDVCSFLNRLKIRKMQMSLSEWLRIMKDERWREVPTDLLLMMIDALARDNAKSLVVHNEGDAAEVLAAAEAKAWKKMGDLCRSFAEEYAESIAYFIQMDELEQELALLQDQAIADLDAEWDGQEVVDD